MMARSLEIRLKNLEARRREPGMLFFVWGRTDEEINGILANALEQGELGPTDPNVCVLCENDPMPQSGWKVYRKLTKREDGVLFGRIRAIIGETETELGSLYTCPYRHLTDEQLLPMALGRTVGLPLHSQSKTLDADARLLTQGRL
jgi:hypothetical protein